MGRRVAVSIWLVAILVGIIAGLVWYAVGPAAEAEHISEPTAPITELTMEVYAYPNFSTRLTKCDGTEILLDKNGVIAKDARIETFTDSPARALGNPSEHYDETLTLFVVQNFGGNRAVEKYQWRVSWTHSNIPPHTSGGVGDNGHESSQNTQNLTVFPAGTILRVRDAVQTLESAQTFTVECTFKVG